MMCRPFGANEKDLNLQSLLSIVYKGRLKSVGIDLSLSNITILQ